MAGIAAANMCGKKLLGFSLLEVMVALFLQAFGMLGMTAMQIKALKSTHAALIDSRVQFLLADMAERIHGNGHSTYQLGFADTTPLATKNCISAMCSSVELALWDVEQWRSAIENPEYLPDGESEIAFDATAGHYSISIRYGWNQLGELDLIGQKRVVTLHVSAGR